jgi:hypothetical protein
MISASITEEHRPLRSASAASRPQGENLPQWHCLEVQAWPRCVAATSEPIETSSWNALPPASQSCVRPVGNFRRRGSTKPILVLDDDFTMLIGGSRRGGYWTWWKPSPCRMGPARRHSVGRVQRGAVRALHGGRTPSAGRGQLSRLMIALS